MKFHAAWCVVLAEVPIAFFRASERSCVPRWYASHDDRPTAIDKRRNQASTTTPRNDRFFPAQLRTPTLRSVSDAVWFSSVSGVCLLKGDRRRLGSPLPRRSCSRWMRERARLARPHRDCRFGREESWISCAGGSTNLLTRKFGCRSLLGGWN